MHAHQPTITEVYPHLWLSHNVVYATWFLWGVICVLWGVICVLWVSSVFCGASFVFCGASPMFCGAEVRPQRSAADVRRELDAREKARNHVKLIWRALAAMASGKSAAAACLQQTVSSQLQQLSNSIFLAAASVESHSCCNLSSCKCTVAATTIQHSPSSSQ